ncbi:hypothetical protein BZA70DRAFT_152508 [Myxozyma melibiosi]|uniref:Uncharacterized protein n=1 Tax=Myxozyma melibiosi TaxID=54550 RepID=A0ABR1F653_9ASCO
MRQSHNATQLRVISHVLLTICITVFAVCTFCLNSCLLESCIDYKGITCFLSTVAAAAVTANSELHIIGGDNSYISKKQRTPPFRFASSDTNKTIFSTKTLTNAGPSRNKNQKILRSRHRSREPPPLQKDTHCLVSSTGATDTLKNQQACSRFVHCGLRIHLRPPPLDRDPDCCWLPERSGADWLPLEASRMVWEACEPALSVADWTCEAAWWTSRGADIVAGSCNDLKRDYVDFVYLRKGDREVRGEEDEIEVTRAPFLYTFLYNDDAGNHRSRMTKLMTLSCDFLVGLGITMVMKMMPALC